MARWLYAGSMSATFWNSLAKRYAMSPVADEESYQEKLRITRGYFEPNMEVLELGCGTGSTAITHAPYLKHIRAVDFSSKMLEIAATKAATAKIDNISFERSSVDGLSVADSSMDAVLGLSLLHLLDDKEAAIAKVYRMLRAGGVFVTSTSCIAGTIKPWSLSAVFFHLILPIGGFLRLLPRVKSFTSEELEESLTNAGFAIDHRWLPGEGTSVFIVAKKEVPVEEYGKEGQACP